MRFESGTADGRKQQGQQGGGPIRRTAPARVNLIGEHTDYTGGLVLPIAIPFETAAELTPAYDGLYMFTCDSFAGERTLREGSTEADATYPSAATGDWSDYPVGVLRELAAMGVSPAPFRLHISGNIPMNAGLSSSASIEVATAMALLAHAGHTLPAADIARLCQRAENGYVGSPCGIMDQYVITAAETGHALLLNTRDLSTELLPMTTGELGACVVVIVNSMVRHTVTAGSAYAERRHELEIAQSLLRSRFGVRDLGDVTAAQLESVRQELSPVCFRRARHVVTENARVRDAAAAMRAGDAAALGALMTAAHASYRDDFEASVPEVDFLVETALAQPRCLGARLTGGGFGGCIVALVDAEHAGRFTETVHAAYLRHYGLDADVATVCPVDGAVARAQAVARTPYAGPATAQTAAQAATPPATQAATQKGHVTADA